MDTSFLREHSNAIIVVISMILGIFSYAPFGHPIFAWIWPALLVYAVRRMSMRNALIASFVAVIIPLLVSHGIALGGGGPSGGSSTVTTMDIVVCVLTIVLICVMSALPFVFDRIAYGKVSKYAQMFILPLTLATVTFISNFTVWGTALSIGYSQADFIWFTQGLSIYGMCGLVFILGWFATSVNLFIESYSMSEKIDWPSTICAFVIVAIVIFGGVRLATTNNSDGIDVMCANGPFDLDKENPTLDRNILCFDTVFNKAMAEDVDLVVFSETAFYLTKDTISKFEEYAIDRSNESGIDVLYTPKYVAEGKEWNECAFISHDKGLEWRYVKTLLLPLGDSENTAGNGTIYHSVTSHGKISSVICMELEFPRYVNGVQHDTDIILAPSQDWKGLDYWHTKNTSFRAIENGSSLLRCTIYGTIGSYDSCGRQIACVNNFPSSVDQTYVVKVCTNGCETLYGNYGKAIDWLFVFAFIVLAGAEIYLYYGRKNGARGPE